jgi:isoleucyl-tRNA synthetase
VLPFVTEEMYQDLVVGQRAEGADGPRSVHHEDYPTSDEALIDRHLEQAMSVIRDVVSLGRGLRVQNRLKIRQPLPSLTVVSHDAAVRAAVAAHHDLVADELNVKAVHTSEDERAHAHLSVKPNYRTLGPRLGGRMREVAAAIESLPEDVIGSLLDGETVDAAGESIALDDVVVSREPKGGIVVASGERLSVALDTALSDDLVREALAREIVKAVQGLRRDAGLDVSDRIRLTWDAAAESVTEAFAYHGEWIAAEVLATDLTRGSGGREVDVDGKPVMLGVARA